MLILLFLIRYFIIYIQLNSNYQECGERIGLLIRQQPILRDKVLNPTPSGKIMFSHISFPKIGKDFLICK